MLDQIELTRKEAVAQIDPSKRAVLGQFFTPGRIASFMAGLFTPNFPENIAILDAGAAVGSLTGALLDQVAHSKKKINSIIATTYEVDPLLNNYLKNNIEKYKPFFAEKGMQFSFSQFGGDFIRGTIPQFVLDRKTLFTHAILNPPYKKINADSDHRKLLRLMDFETVNLYAAFVGIAINLLKPHGELVAIIPRSFCNGNYYKGFRELILEKCAICQMHLFESRTHAFKEDDVLQENIIIHLMKGQKQGKVCVSRSKDSLFNDLTKTDFDFSSIVKPGDAELFFHVPEFHESPLPAGINQKLKDLQLFVSTGPVVDFRAKDVISQDPKKGFVPLIYPVHFNGTEIDWPKESKKPNAIKLDDTTKSMMYPNGYYTVVRRFSPKEEKQRIVARVINPNRLDFKYIGVENHLNLFHAGKIGMTEDQAFGIAAYLNSSMIDRYFRTFNGHTQVNATDLKQLPYPPLDKIVKLGKWAKKQKSFEPNKIDIQIAKLYE